MKTAVEFLLSHIWTTDWVNYTKEEKLKVIEQAKKMEKQQIIDAFGVGCHLESKRLIEYHDVAEQYYNETYVSKDIALQNQSKSKAITELSDEEIEKAAAHHEPMITRRAWVSACKWYREQLKNKL
jgi:hypothetical protein